jgi:hypothetical protein
MRHLPRAKAQILRHGFKPRAHAALAHLPLHLLGPAHLSERPAPRFFWTQAPRRILVRAHLHKRGHLSIQIRICRVSTKPVPPQTQQPRPNLHFNSVAALLVERVSLKVFR